MNPMMEGLHADIHPSPPLGDNGHSRPHRGKLRIFLGMAPGVGKTRTMLQAAQRERLAGRDVIIACLHDGDLASKSSAVKGMPQLERGPDAPNSPSTTDLDLALILARNPDIAVVDELAHSNGPNCRHQKRHQDVVDLLEAGIDVFATLSIQQVASRTDSASRITGKASGEVVPDTILDTAELELVDVAPHELLKRISRGEVRLTAAEAAKAGLLDESKLMALRELTVRLFAERVGRDVSRRLAEAKSSGPASSGQRLLVVVVPGTDSEAVVRSARRFADSFHASWIVLYVETSRPLPDEAQAQVTKTLSFARELGAEVLTTADEDVVGSVLRVAAQRNVNQIILGKSADRKRVKLGRNDAILPRLLRESGSLEVHVVPAEDAAAVDVVGGVRQGQGSICPQYAKAIGVIAVVTLAAFVFTPLVGAHATALVFLLTVVLLALFVERGPTLAAATLSALLWDYFFLPPIYAFRITHFEDAMLLGMYFIVALVLGHLTSRIRAQEEAERQRESRSTALYLLTRELSESVGLDEMVQRVVTQMEGCFKGQVAVLLPENGSVLRIHQASTFKPGEGEREIAQWAWKHRQRAGKFTTNSAFAQGLYLPLVTNSGAVGVVGLRLEQRFAPTIQQENLLQAFSHQIGMALDRYRLNRISEKTKLLAESERLSKTLLDSMSHEIRTPIAAIESATGNLAELLDSDSEIRQQMIAEIKEATDRLNRLVGNVLEASRLESGAVKPRFNECDVGELIHVAMAQTEKELSAHKITITIQPGLPLVPMDFVLMQHALTNLISNAALHTPAGTSIEIGARLKDEGVVLSVADRGPGIPADSLPRLFDKFYRVPNSRTGGTGLGLSLVKGFVEAQGGRVTVQNRPGGGVAFTIRLAQGNPASTPGEGDL